MDFSICMQFVSIICKCMYNLSPSSCTTTKLQNNTRTNHDISSENSNLSLELLVRKCEKVEVIRIQNKITDTQLNDGIIQIEIDGSFHDFNGSGTVKYVDVVLEFKAPKGEETHSCRIQDWDKGVASKMELVWEIPEANQDTNKLVVIFRICLINESMNVETGSKLPCFYSTYRHFRNRVMNTPLPRRIPANGNLSWKSQTQKRSRPCLGMLRIVIHCENLHLRWTLGLMRIHGAFCGLSAR